jgi:dTDP-4-dehydrorhamnose reductase
MEHKALEHDAAEAPFFFGFGYCAQAYARLMLEDEPFVATLRQLGKAAEFRARFPEGAFLLFDGAAPSPMIDTALGQSQALLSSIPANGDDPALACHRASIVNAPIETIIYLSTIGVYGDSAGAWVDEDTPPRPENIRTRDRVEAERQWLSLAAHGKRVFVLRLAGIYGPGQNALVNLRAGTARRVIKPGQVFNRIHVDDIAGAVESCLRSQHAGGVFNVCDDEPAPPQDVIAYAARKAGFEVPPDIPFAQAQLSPMAASFWSSCKRASNDKIKRELGWRPRYRSYREGIDALAAAF